MKKADILIFAPHPIDIEIGMGGTVAHWTREGKAVVYVICTTGDKASSDPNMTIEKLAPTRKQEQLSSAEFLGVKEVIFLGYPDLGLKDTPEFRKDIIRLLLEYRPEIVGTCDPFEKYLYNPDHHVTGHAVMNAVWPCLLAPNTYRDLIGKDFKLHKVKEIMLYATSEPNYVHDISDTFDTKMKACSYHKSQIGDPMENEFIELVTNLNKSAAEGHDFKYAEAFHRREVLQRL